MKKAGLGAYLDRVRWDKYSLRQKILAWLRHGPYFVYIDLGNARVRRQNEKEARQTADNQKKGS